MRKLKKKIPVALVMGLSVVAFSQVEANALSEGRTGVFNFDNNTIINDATGKTYNVPKNGSFVSGFNNTALKFNIRTLSIPLADIGVNNDTENVTISYWFKWNGETNNTTPVSFNSYMSTLSKDYFGFSTGNGDVYGMSNPFVKGKYTHVTLVMNKSDYQLNSIYINGEKQTLTQKLGTQNTYKTGFKYPLLLGGVYFTSEIDELSVLNREATDIEVKQLFEGTYQGMIDSSVTNTTVNNPPSTTVVNTGDTSANNQGTTTTSNNDTPQYVVSNSISYDGNPKSDGTGASEPTKKDEDYKYMVKVIGTFKATTLDIKVPAVTSFLYNPNTQVMTAQRMGIFNDTNAPVYMKLNRIAVADESIWKPSLVAPNRYTDSEWRNLTQAQSKEEVSLGLKASEDEDWLNNIEINNLWSVGANNTKIGVIKNHTSVEAEPTLQAGTSLSTQDILTANYVFEFGLAE